MSRVQTGRTREVIEAELAEAITRRDHAARILDFDAFGNLVEQIDDLLVEHHALFPPQRPPVA